LASLKSARRKKRGNSAYPAAERLSQPPLSRLGLHAWSLEIEHPTTGERLRFTAPYPSDFENALGWLRNFLTE
jgi:23S rRNA-/tRNA-specific pseudouridylate synthase